jgi:hypothetical protein
VGYGPGFKDKDLGFRVEDSVLGFRVYVSGERVEGLGFRV